MPSLQLKPSEGPVGAEVTAIGSGFRPNVSYRIQIDNDWLRPGTTNNRGTFVTVFRVPPVPYGEQDVIAVSQAAHQLAHATFNVIPHITHIEPVEITAGEMVTLRGTGMGSNELIEVTLNERPVNVDGEVRTKPDGTFIVRFTPTEEMISARPVVIGVTGQGTNASTQAEEEIDVVLTS
jgi:hypothetical protein